MNEGEMLDMNERGNFRTINFSSLILKMKMSETITENRGNERGDREMNIASLMKNIKAIEESYKEKISKDQQERKKRAIYRNLTEIHKKISISFGVFAFILLGSIIGVTLKKSSLALGFTISTVLFVLYYMMLVLGEQFSDKGIVNPVISIWFPNYITLALCIFLIYSILNKVEILNLSFINRFKKKNENT